MGQFILGPNQFDNGVIEAMYNASNFEPLALALAGLEHWNTATVAEKKAVNQLYGTYLSPSFMAEYYAVSCNDTPWSRDPSYWVARSGKDSKAYPLVGSRELEFSTPCAYWPYHPPTPLKITGAGLPPILMLNSTHDPATSYEGAVRAHRQLHNSRLVTVTGGGDHGQYLNKNTCVDGVVNTFLLTGAAPRQDTICPANPLPIPPGSRN